MPSQVEVAKSDLESATVVEIPQRDLAEGSVRLEVESFSITANNITYAVFGDVMKYWNFFPASEGHGIVPMWGHARVVESKHASIDVGERVYGYLPMATHLDVTPDKLSASGFMDAAPHRQPMSPIYNQYSRIVADPEHDPAHEAERMIFGPLFKTGFLIEGFMRAEGWFGALQLVMTSASSKTAMGLASVAKERSPHIRRIGCTSAANVAFTQSTGFYDEVHAYDAVPELMKSPAITVDFAGNAQVLAALHRHYGDALKYSCLVGATHIESRGGGLMGDGKALPGPTPTLFFAPDHAVAALKALGPKGFGEEIARSWRVFLTGAKGTVKVETRTGIAAARDTYLEMVGGTVDPARGIVIEL